MTAVVVGARVAGRDLPSAPGTASESRDPASGEVVAVVGEATAEQVGLAVAAAHEAWLGWRDADAATRGAALRALAADLRGAADELSRSITRETGKLVAESRAEVDLSCRYLEWYADTAPAHDDPAYVDGTPAQVVTVPVGPVAAVTTWNFPLSIPVRKLAAALAAGCAVVLKPSPLAPATALDLVSRCERHLPAGLVTAVLGGPAVATRLVTAEPVRAVTFTGSTEVGLELAAVLARRLTRSVLELGGRAPAVVLADADVDAAAEVLMTAKFRNNGSSCIAANNVFVHADLAPDLLDALADRVRGLRPGDPLASTSTLGPLRTPALARSVERWADQARRAGCRVVRGETAGGSDCFTAPVLVDSDRPTEAWDREVFGPLLQVRAYRDEAAVVDEVNGWRRGLGGYVLSADRARATDLARRLRVGVLGVGTGTPNAPERPFGGFDLAGWGREGARAGLAPFLEHQTIAYGG